MSLQENLIDVWKDKGDRYLWPEPQKKQPPFTREMKIDIVNFLKGKRSWANSGLAIGFPAKGGGRSSRAHHES